MTKQIIQIAGVRNADEARMLKACGVDRIGIPLRLAVHKPDVTEDEAARLIRETGIAADTVLITYLDHADDIAGFCATLGIAAVQLHGDIAINELVRLRQIAPGLLIIKSLIVRRDNLDELARSIADTAQRVDEYITDTHDPATGATGATGKPHDWRISRALVEMSPKPLMLAGGLTPLNVGQAINDVQPFGVDVHTGVEDAHGCKDRGMVMRFVAESRAAWASLG